jgi:hypothetical protein
MTTTRRRSNNQTTDVSWSTITSNRLHTIRVTLLFGSSVGRIALPAGGGASVLQISLRNGKGAMAVAMEVIARKN